MLTPEHQVLCILGLRPTGDLGPLTSYTSRRGRIVWFLKAPPTCPPSPRQQHQRNVFRLVAIAWNALTDQQREQWHLAEHRGSLNMTGFNLFTYWSTTHDDAAIRTVERQTNTNLIS